MKKLKMRSMAVLIMAFAVLAGLAFFAYRLITEGESWVSFRANGNIYENGRITRGKIFDRDGNLLAEMDEKGIIYSEDENVRRATVHVLGDPKGNISGGAIRLYSGELIGYSAAEGLYAGADGDETVTLSVSEKLSVAAMEALGDMKGAAGVVNYKTGEVLCMVSSPSFDPVGNGEDIQPGAYLNKSISAAYTPGSVFKLVIVAAAMEYLPDLFERDFHCEGEEIIGGGRITCISAHGDMKIEDALAKSCNIVFAELADELGGERLSEHAKKLGFTDSFSFDSFKTAAGRYDVYPGGTPELAWSGAGQSTDLVVPAAMLRYVSAIANGGVWREFTLHKNGSGGEVRLLDAETAEKIAEMMEYNVFLTYGRENFPGLSIAAKSGTAEVGGGMEPHAWFVGFSTDEELPLAFAVVCENGGSGTYTAGRVAEELLQFAKECL